jgi:hypothetical protein
LPSGAFSVPNPRRKPAGPGSPTLHWPTSFANSPTPTGQRGFLDRLTRDEVQQYYERYIGPYFTPDGQVDLTIAQQGIDAVAAELGLASVAADEIYQR